MSRFICQVISNEDIYRNINNANFLSNKQNKSVSLKYESVTIDDKIAQGGYGTVYKAHSFNKEYALKKLCVNNEDKLLNCIQEIFILRNIHNDYIVHYIDSIIYQTDNEIFKVFILTDFYAGNLSSEIKAKHSINRVFEESDILKIMTNISEAVACLHHFLSHPIIHRDLKVENILIGYPTKYVLCDFGSATLKEVKPCEVNRQELQDEILQYTTLAYRSPEMADLYFEGGEHVIGRKSDIWAMGVMLYNICFFSLPFGDSVLSILSGQFTVPDHHTYSDNLMKIVNHCLTIDPQQRPDIYQLSTLLYAICAKSNPIPNYEKSGNPEFDTLSLPMTESEAKSVHTNRKQKNVNKHCSMQPVATSINPRDRPKPIGKSNSTVAPRKSNSNELKNNEDLSRNIADLLVFDSESRTEMIPETNDAARISRPKSIDEFEIQKVDESQTDDLMDFKAPINEKLKQLSQTPKSQSLGKNFNYLGTGQRFNVYEMISHSYQNVYHPPQFPYQNLHPNNPMGRPPNNFPVQPNNPFMVNNNPNMATNYSQNHHPNNYPYPSQIGHRRLVSDPSSWYQNPTKPPVQSKKESVTNVLQPTKIHVKQTVTNVLDEFDPLTK